VLYQSPTNDYMNQPTNINGHKQVTSASCIPMSVECVLKIIGLMPITDFSLQDDAKKSGTSDWVMGFKFPYTDPKVVFSREYLLSDMGLPDRGPHFMKDYFSRLFDTMDKELNEGRYVIISLESGPGQWHMEVVYERVSDNAYNTVTFYHGQSGPKHLVQDLRSRVTLMQGTDILTYKFI
jgi:hypothetical protein